MRWQSVTRCYTPADAFARAEPRSVRRDASRTRRLDSTLTISDLRWLLLLWRQLWTGHQDPEWNPDTGTIWNTFKKHSWGSWSGLTFGQNSLPASSSIQICADYAVLKEVHDVFKVPICRSLDGVWSQDKVMSTHKSSIIHPQGHWNILKHIDMFGPWLRTSVPFTDLTT